MDPPDVLEQAEISRSVTTRWLGRRVHVFRSVGSTNETLKEMAREGEPAGTMVIADFQRRGKGRFKRRWKAPSGTSLLISLLFRPSWHYDRANWLTMLAGVAAATAVEDETGLFTRLKWPNDVIVRVDGVWSKVGGLLLESEINGEILSQMVLGTGLNVNIPTNQLPQAHSPVSSLMVALGRPVSRLSLLRKYLELLERFYEEAESGISPVERWGEWLLTLGHDVIVSGIDLKQPIAGIAESIDEWGNLLVRDESNRVHKIAAADVTLRV